ALADSAMARSDDPTSLLRLVLAAAAVWRRRRNRLHPACRRLPGSSMTRRSPPWQHTSVITGAILRRRFLNPRSRSNAPAWRSAQTDGPLARLINDRKQLGLRDHCAHACATLFHAIDSDDVKFRVFLADLECRLKFGRIEPSL